MNKNIKRGVIGTASSIIASILIFLVLAAVYERGVQAAFTPPCIYTLALLLAVGLTAYYGYLGYSRTSLWRMKHVSPIALALGAAAVAVGYSGRVELAGALVFASYIVETSVGLKLYEDYARDSRVGALLFIVGVSLFVASLPLIILKARLALLGLIGDTIKLAGLIIILGALLGEAARGRS